MDLFQDIIKTILGVSSDVIVLLATTAILTGYGIFSGKDKIVSFILSLYPTAFLFRIIPFFRDVLGEASGTSKDVLIKLCIFGLIFVPIHLVINNFIITDFPMSRLRKLVEAGLLGLTGTAVILSFSYQVVNISKLYNFSSGIDALFIAGNFFWWLIGSFVVLFFFRK